MNPRIAAPWGLAALACAAIMMGFRANETAPQPAVEIPSGSEAPDAIPGEDLVSVSVSVSDCRARAAVPQTPHGVGGGATLRRAQFSRGEPGLLMPKDAVSAACARVTPGALPSMQPPVSSAH